MKGIPWERAFQEKSIQQKLKVRTYLSSIRIWKEDDMGAAREGKFGTEVRYVMWSLAWLLAMRKNRFQILIKQVT